MVEFRDSWLGTGGDRKYSSNNKVFNDIQKQNPKDGRYTRNQKMRKSGLKSKDLIGIPWMVAFALRQSGWYLRQDIIWQKPNAMPESVKDRCTKSHEYIFLLSKSQRYYFDNESIKEPRVGTNDYPPAGNKGTLSPNSRLRGSGNKERKQRPCSDILKRGAQAGSIPYDGSNNFRNKRDVWNIAIKSFKGAHFATYPEELIKPCVLAGCPEGGVTLDPFMGAGTTGVVSKRHNRNYVGIELNPEYIKIAENRIDKTA